LRCNARGGVEVDAELTTSDPRIHAVGECARHASIPEGLVAPGYAMADTLASRLAEQRGRLGAQQAVTRLKLDMTEVTVLGNPLQAVHDQELLHVAPGCYRRLLLRRRRVVAAVVVGAWQELATLQRLVVSSRRVAGRSLARFSREGRLGMESASLPVVQWPSGTVVCQCANVTAGVLRESFAVGCKTPDALGRATSAGTLCGSCRPLLAALCGSDAAPAPEKNRLLLPGAAALLFGAAVALAPRIEFPQSISDWSVHAAWTETKWKQLSGFAVLAVMSAALLLSLRKRVRRFSFGKYSGWRIAHAVLGTLALVGLFAHTGFRLGNNLNLALSVAFLTSALSGGLSALVPASLGRVSALCRRAHDYAFWLLPTLLTFHVVKSYYF
jgi:nitrite reductase (NADH) large subunit